MPITCIMYTYIHSIITTIATDWNDRIKIINVYSEMSRGKNQEKKKKRVSMLDSCRQPNTNTNTYTNRISSNCSNNSPNCVTTQCSYSIWIKTREKKNWENPEILDSDDVFFPFEFDCTGYENVESCEREWAHLCVLFLSSSFLIFFSVLISDHSSDATQSSVK